MMQQLTSLLKLDEVSNLRCVKSAAAETMGTAILVLVGCGSAGTLAPESSTMAVAFCFGLGLALSIWLFGQVSGAHVNPAVTLGFFVTGHIGILKSLVYILSQSFGAVLGAGIIRLTVPEPLRGMMGITTLTEGVEQWQAFIIEMVTTFLLVMTVFASCDRLRTDHSGSTALSIGFCVTVCIAWSGVLTGGSMNPARSFGPAVWTGIWDNHWIYWTAPITGGMAAALLYQKVFAETLPEVKQDLHFRQNKLNTNDVRREGFLDHTIVVDGPGVLPIQDSPQSGRFNFKHGRTRMLRHEDLNVTRLDSLRSTKSILTRRDSGLGVNDDGSDDGSLRGLTIYSNNRECSNSRDMKNDKPTSISKL